MQLQDKNGDIPVKSTGILLRMWIFLVYFDEIT